MVAVVVVLLVLVTPSGFVHLTSFRADSIMASSMRSNVVSPIRDEDSWESSKATAPSPPPLVVVVVRGKHRRAANCGVACRGPLPSLKLLRCGLFPCTLLRSWRAIRLALPKGLLMKCTPKFSLFASPAPGTPTPRRRPRDSSTTALELEWRCIRVMVGMSLLENTHINI